MGAFSCGTVFETSEGGDDLSSGPPELAVFGATAAMTSVISRPVSFGNKKATETREGFVISPAISVAISKAVASRTAN
jgi:hypothetical protein